MKRLVLILTLALSAVLLQGATYYVATTGNDSSAGTTLGTAWRTFGKGVTNVSAGDTLLVGAGYYNESFPLFTQRSGTAANPIVLDGQGVATIKYLGLLHQYIYVINFGLSNGSSGAMVDMGQPAGHCVLSNNVFDNGYVSGVNFCIKWTGPSGADLPFSNVASDCIVISNTFKHLAGDMTAISVFGDNNRIWGNSIYNVDNIDFFHVWGRTNLFYGNLCSNNWQSGLYGGHPDLVQSYGDAGQGGEANVFERNKFVHGYGYCQMGMYEGRTNRYLHDITFRNNYFIGISKQASMIYRDVRWYNNLFYRCFTNENGAGNFGLLYGPDASTNYTNWALSTGHGGHVVNNIFLGGGSLTNPMERGHYSFTPGLTPGLSNILADYNYVGTLAYGPVLSNTPYHAVGSPDGWDVDLFWETNGINGGNLLMTDPANLDFRIPTNSPLYRRGTNLSWMFTTDHAGNTRPAVENWTIGPLEAESGAGPAAPTIDVQPQSTNVIPGQSVTFSVTASGTSPLAYQWHLGGARITGATNSTYTTNAVRLAANGNVYSVSVTNSLGGLVSSNATLGVGVPYEEIICRVNPRAVRAYTVALTNQIRLVWPTNEYRTALIIGKRAYTNRISAWRTWAEIYTNTTSPTAEGEYVDTLTTNGIHYEYFVESRVTNWVCDGVTTNSPVADRIYINTGTQVPLKDTRGSVILLVESNLATLVPTELATLTNDLIGDGYKVYRTDVPSANVDQPGWSNAVGTTKAIIQNFYNTDTNETWTLFMVGHVPVPYSGTNSSPGSHTNNTGAMYADWYYGVMNNALWTDNLWNGAIVRQDFAHTTNLYYDGKWDQDYVPAVPELSIGRLDLTNMPMFGTEQLLTKRYLDREHQWRHKQFTAREKGIRLYSPYSSEPVVCDSVLASVLDNPVTNNTYGTWLNYATNTEHSYLLADHGGTGYYTYDLTLGSNINFLRTNLYTVFNLMYGSYYGDADSGMHSNHILRSPLVSTGYCLMTIYRETRTMLNAFSMNETIGEQIRQDTGNNFASATAASPYYATYAGGSFGWHVRNNYAYTSIQGDPTLRLRVVYPPSAPLVTRSGSDLVVSWTASADTGIVGYHVYRCPAGARNSMTRLTTSPVASPYTNSGAYGTAYDYMVRAVKLDEYTTRSFYNASQGVFASYTETGGAADVSINPESWTLSKLTNSTASSTNYVLSNSGLTNVVEYSNVVSGTWLFVSPAGGTFTNSATNTVTAYATNLTAGTYTNRVLTYSWTNDVVLETNTFTVTMTVTNAPAGGGSATLAMAPPSMIISCLYGAQAGATNYTLSNTGDQELVIYWTNGVNGAWIERDTTHGTVSTDTDTIGVTFLSPNLTPGSYTGWITNWGWVAGELIGTQTLAITLNITNAPPTGTGSAKSTTRGKIIPTGKVVLRSRELD